MNQEANREKLIVGKYQLLSKIGAGAMGEVYEGRHLVTEERVAVKLLTREVNDSEVWLQRFNREATAASRIGHPGITQIHDAGFDENLGRYYLAMEFLEGETFGARVSDGRISLGHSLLVIYELLDALSAAHNSSVIHRDVKPENIFIETIRDGTERVKLLDFGIAKEQNKPSATMGEVSIGTPYYMSPEQARATASITYRTDIWSVGVILYWLIAGRPPFMGESSYDIVLKACATPHKPIAPRPGIPPRLIELIEICLQKAPEDRSLDALMLRDELEKLIGDDSTWSQLTETATDLSILFVSPRDLNASPLNTDVALASRASNQKPFAQSGNASAGEVPPEQSTGDIREMKSSSDSSPSSTTGDLVHVSSSGNVVRIPKAKKLTRRESALQRPSSLPTQLPLGTITQEPKQFDKQTGMLSLAAALVLALVLIIGYYQFSSQQISSEPVELKNIQPDIVSNSQKRIEDESPVPNAELESINTEPARPALKTIKRKDAENKILAPMTTSRKLKGKNTSERIPAKRKSKTIASPPPEKMKAKQDIDPIQKAAPGQASSDDTMNSADEKPIETAATKNTDESPAADVEMQDTKTPQELDKASAQSENEKPNTTVEKNTVKQKSKATKKSVAEPESSKTQEQKPKDESSDQDEFFSF